jgi:phage N-6-adenine-methyltransferase
MTINSGLLTSKTDLWATPQHFFDEWNSIYNFELDVCANEENKKCVRYFNEEQNGLVQDWGGSRVWCNPPYGRQIGFWVKKAYEESLKGSLVVMLLPSRTDTKWWHEYVIDKQAEVVFIKGRLKFGDSKNSAPFPSAIAIFGNK